MDYRELIQLALQGRSVNAAAKDFGVTLSAFQRYVKGERLPDYDLGLRLVEAAGVDLATGFLILAAKQREFNKSN